MTETLKAIARCISETPDEVLVFSFSLLMFVGILLAVYWYFNRRRMHQLSHQIPASVVKNYLDSIIQNSSALKSSLFRGGGLDIGEGVPSVVPVGELPSGNIPLSSGDNHSAELNLRLAEIAKLTKTLTEKEALVRDLEKRLLDAQSNQSAVEGNEDQSAEISALKAEIARLKELLNQAPASTGGDEQLQKELDAVTAERNELKERLMEYEIIEEDLANLKRLQQENEQLKRQLAGGAPAVEPVAEPPAEEVVPAKEVEIAGAPSEPEPPPAEEEIDLEAEMAAAIGGAEAEAEVEEPEQSAEAIEEGEEQPAAEAKEKKEPQDQKSAEELLSEFEKMLG